jgi:hypothetical protein
MRIESEIETIRKVWINDGYLLVRPWPDDISCVELCTEPGEQSQGWWGTVSITFGTPEGVKCLAKALMLAADEMQSTSTNKKS